MVMFDYCGIGEVVVIGLGVLCFVDWGWYDIDVVLKWVYDMFVFEGCGGCRLVVFGYSVGG